MCHVDHKDGSLATNSRSIFDGSSSKANETAFEKLLAANPSNNPITALASNEPRSLFVCRFNGDVVRYRLPELWPEVNIHAIDKMPVRIEINCDAS